MGVRSPRPGSAPSASPALWRWAFVPASLARTPSFFFQAAGRRCGPSPSLPPAGFPAPPAAPPFRTRVPRGAGPTRARARLVPGGGLEPFQDSNAFSLLDFEMTIYHYN